MAEALPGCCEDSASEAQAGDLQRKVRIEGKTVTVDGMYLRIIIHDNEHMGQLIAYARMNGIVPPWAKPETSSTPKYPDRPKNALQFSTRMRLISLPPATIVLILTGCGYHTANS